ncbi:prepilin-type N-terminal cleavage/methylation domain-containing protein [Chloroflexota bacterium]
MISIAAQCRRISNQRGSTLIEILVATAILGVIGVVFVSAISAGTIGAGKVEERSTAESIARTQIEFIKSLPYADSNSYPPVVTSSGYEPRVEVTELSPAEYPNTLQKIVVTVFRDGRSLLSIETFKVNR